MTRLKATTRLFEIVWINNYDDWFSSFVTCNDSEKARLFVETHSKCKRVVDVIYHDNHILEE